MEDNASESPGKKKGFFHRLFHFLRDLVILALILVPCGYSVKLQLKLKDAQQRADSLQAALTLSHSKLDSLKLNQDNEAILRDSLDDLIDRRLEEMASEVMITIDTTLSRQTAQKAIEDNIGTRGWVDTLCAPYPEGVSAHVKLHFLKSQAVRLERLEHHLATRFPEE